MKDKKHWKNRDHCYYTGEYRRVAYSICNFKCNIPKRTSIAFHNGSNYDYYFIIKKALWPLFMDEVQLPQG